ncbi:OOP family OmpA-OmpF porin [Herbaspirillum sp. Sphag1AN]|uniref:outer membrane beta-barrel protein n=1 Tax=unclassified Herbaspirillum TaxID=2624150 RepID=UPI00161B349E|nr:MULTISPECIES: outer membrane beta-barrel protein [unclassified Herbaspirillum]MBB3211506.1 OOP family OmpA-OmpF porin [Herbaspirillum sp. Sphag1AN]MBB3245228.1 OOP family OmpA-OmpF porin [Herbaspirillum sp. Sphag64]
MNSRILTISIGACLLAASTYANAATPEKEGWYLGAGIGYSHYKVPKPEEIYEDGELKNSGTGVKLYGGYQFNNIWAVEFEYVEFGTSTYKTHASAYPSNEIRITSSGIGISGVGNLPLSNEFSVFGKLGALTRFSRVHGQKDYVEGGPENQITSQTYKSTSIAPMLGLGAEYHLTQNVSLRAEYEYFGKSKLKDTDFKLGNELLSIGVRYNF